MSTIQQLENAILERIKKQEIFKTNVKDALTKAFKSLPPCNGNDEVSNTININKEQFASLLDKLHNDKSLNREAVQQLIQSTTIKDLKRGLNSKSDLRSSDSSYHTANGEEFVYEKPVPVNTTTSDLLPDPNIKVEDFKFGGKRARQTRRR
jgi:hypothetical protein